MKDLAWLGVYAAVVLALLWPSGRAGQAVLSVTAGFGSVLRSGAAQATGGAQ
jgi:hypothetical protein